MTGALVPELAAYVGSLSPEQLCGVVFNVKGIDHGLLFEHAANIAGDEISACVFEANHPNGGVEFLVVAALTATKVLWQVRVGCAQMLTLFEDVAVGAVATTALYALLKTLI